MYLAFDAETTGLPDYNLELTDPKQPHILQLGMILFDDAGKELVSCKLPIAPEGRFVVDEQGEAFKVNGLSNDFLNKVGFPLPIALRVFRMLEDRAVLKIAHHYRFDGFLIKCAHARANIQPKDPAIDKFCTMKVMQELAKAPNLKDRPPNGKLRDCVPFVTGKPLEGHHDALADVRGCKDVFLWIKSQGYYKAQPRVVPGKAA